MSVGTLVPHHLAELFPLIEGPEFLALVEDIREHGIRDRIELLDLKILDGRNRYNALVYLAETGELLGEGWGHRAGEPLEPEHLEPDNQWFRKFNVNVDGDPLPWVLSKNLKRRHLNDVQRASVAAKIANLGVGRPSGPIEPAPEHIPPIGGISAQAAAAMLNVSPRQVARMRVVHAEGGPDVRDAADHGVIAASAAEKIARMPLEQQPEAVQKALPAGSRAIMSSRLEPDDSLDFFPTPPWATRALIEHVLLAPGLTPAQYIASAWEPACGEGHIAEVLAEYIEDVAATDIHDYGYGAGDVDFLSDAPNGLSGKCDWIITNPPFAEKGEAFVLRALERARVGVAMFVRLQWLESIGRYENVFRDHPPTLVSFFAERVNLCKGRWDPEGTTATAYIWLVWIKGVRPQAPFWIPPGRREALTRPDDAERFTQHPVLKIDRSQAKAGACAAPKEPPGIEPPAGRVADGRTSDAGAAALHAAPAPLPAAASGPLGGRADPLDIPDFLRRQADNAAPFAKVSS